MKKLPAARRRRGRRVGLGHRHAELLGVRHPHGLRGALGLISNPKAMEIANECRKWMRGQAACGVRVLRGM
jgi:hypothetical protein